ncbi:cellulose binding domain-containing protein [Micromonospora sp. LOL_021]|uniref:cellulose binding domain-containing protein n=1 Tax=Micromonospora sp. LOL_021 TaxID=3345417 RepID=UPI003A881760
MSMPQPPHHCRRWIRRDPNRTRRQLGVAVAAALLGPPLLPASAALAAADTVPPTTPGTPTVAAISTTDVTLVWTAATDDVGVTGYEVARLHTDYIVISTTPDNEITIDGLGPSQTYQFWVYALDAAGNRSPASPSLRLTMPPGDDQPPTAPTALTATTIGTDSVTLRWQPSADNVYVAWYEVLRINPDGSTTPVATAPQHPPTGPTARVGALQPQTAYTFVVRAHDDAGNTSPPSEPLTVRTLPAAPDCKVSYQVVNHWPGAFQAQLTIHNAGPVVIDGWTLRWTFPGDQQISHLWGAEPIDLVPPDITVANTTWNSRIPVGGSVQLGFVVRYPVSNPPPTDFLLNGNRCASSG